MVKPEFGDPCLTGELKAAEVGRIRRAPIVITVDREQRAARVAQADDAALVAALTARVQSPAFRSTR